MFEELQPHVLLYGKTLLIFTSLKILTLKTLPIAATSFKRLAEGFEVDAQGIAFSVVWQNFVNIHVFENINIKNITDCSHFVQKITRRI